jgi:hypothetical protein
MDEKKTKSTASKSKSKSKSSVKSTDTKSTDTKSAKKIANVENESEKKYLSNVKNFALLVKEILETKNDEKVSSRTTKKAKSPIIEAANRYIKSLDTANCNVLIHLKLFLEYYQEFSKYILKSDKNPEWMNNHKNAINIQLGKGTAFENKNITLKISVACNIALKMKSDIDEASYDNDNEKEEALGNYTYQFVDLFYYRLLLVIKDALEINNLKDDIKKIDKLIVHHKAKTHLNSSSSSSSSEDDDGDTGAGGISNFLKNVTGGENISAKHITKTLEDITSKKEITDKLASTFDNIEKKSKGKEKMGGKEMFSSVMEDLAPALGSIFDAMGTGTDKPKTTEHVSSDTESESSTSSEDN